MADSTMLPAEIPEKCKMEYSGLHFNQLSLGLWPHTLHIHYSCVCVCQYAVKRETPKSYLFYCGTPAEVRIKTMLLDGVALQQGKNDHSDNLSVSQTFY